MRQWNVGLQYQLLPDTALEVRYVGNRGDNLLRAVDLNQLLLPDAFVEDFRRAQRNLAANGAPWLGEPLHIFPLLGFRRLPAVGGRSELDSKRRDRAVHRRLACSFARIPPCRQR